MGRMERRRRWNCRRRASDLAVVIATAIAFCSTGLATAERAFDYRQLKASVSLGDASKSVNLDGSDTPEPEPTQVANGSDTVNPGAQRLLRKLSKKDTNAPVPMPGTASDMNAPIETSSLESSLESDTEAKALWTERSLKISTATPNSESRKLADEDASATPTSELNNESYTQLVNMETGVPFQSLASDPNNQSNTQWSSETPETLTATPGLGSSTDAEEDALTTPSPELNNDIDGTGLQWMNMETENSSNPPTLDPNNSPNTQWPSGTPETPTATPGAGSSKDADEDALTTPSPEPNNEINVFNSQSVNLETNVPSQSPALDPTNPPNTQWPSETPETSTATPGAGSSKDADEDALTTPSPEPNNETNVFNSQSVNLETNVPSQSPALDPTTPSNTQWPSETPDTPTATPSSGSSKDADEDALTTPSPEPNNETNVFNTQSVNLETNVPSQSPALDPTNPPNTQWPSETPETSTATPGAGSSKDADEDALTTPSPEPNNETNVFNSQSVNLETNVPSQSPALDPTTPSNTQWPSETPDTPTATPSSGSSKDADEDALTTPSPEPNNETNVFNTQSVNLETNVPSQSPASDPTNPPNTQWPNGTPDTPTATSGSGSSKDADEDALTTPSPESNNENNGTDAPWMNMETENSSNPPTLDPNNQPNTPWPSETPDTPTATSGSGSSKDADEDALTTPSPELNNEINGTDAPWMNVETENSSNPPTNPPNTQWPSETPDTPTATSGSGSSKDADEDALTTPSPESNNENNGTDAQWMNMETENSSNPPTLDPNNQPNTPWPSETPDTPTATSGSGSSKDADEDALTTPSPELNNEINGTDAPWMNVETENSSNPPTNPPNTQWPSETPDTPTATSGSGSSKDADEDALTTPSPESNNENNGTDAPWMNMETENSSNPPTLDPNNQPNTPWPSETPDTPTATSGSGSSKDADEDALTTPSPELNNEINGTDAPWMNMETENSSNPPTNPPNTQWPSETPDTPTATSGSGSSKDADEDALTTPSPESNNEINGTDAQWMNMETEHSSNPPTNAPNTQWPNETPDTPTATSGSGSSKDADEDALTTPSPELNNEINGTDAPWMNMETENSSNPPTNPPNTQWPSETPDTPTATSGSGSSKDADEDALTTPSPESNIENNGTDAQWLNMETENSSNPPTNPPNTQWPSETPDTPTATSGSGSSKDADEDALTTPSPESNNENNGTDAQWMNMETENSSNPPTNPPNTQWPSETPDTPTATSGSGSSKDADEDALTTPSPESNNENNGTDAPWMNMETENSSNPPTNAPKTQWPSDTPDTPTATTDSGSSKDADEDALTTPVPELNNENNGTDAQWMNMETENSSNPPTLDPNNQPNTQWPSETPDTPTATSGSGSSKDADEDALTTPSPESNNENNGTDAQWMNMETENSSNPPTNPPNTQWPSETPDTPTATTDSGSSKHADEDALTTPVPELNNENNGTDAQWMNMETENSSNPPTLDPNNQPNTQWPSETPDTPTATSGSGSSKDADEDALTTPSPELNNEINGTDAPWMNMETETSSNPPTNPPNTQWPSETPDTPTATTDSGSSKDADEDALTTPVPELNNENNGTDAQWMNMETENSSNPPTLDPNNQPNTQWPNETPDTPTATSGSGSSKDADEDALTTPSPELNNEINGTDAPWMNMETENSSNPPTNPPNTQWPSETPDTPTATSGSGSSKDADEDALTTPSPELNNEINGTDAPWMNMETENSSNPPTNPPNTQWPSETPDTPTATTDSGSSKDADEDALTTPVPELNNENNETDAQWMNMETENSSNPPTLDPNNQPNTQWPSETPQTLAATSGSGSSKDADEDALTTPSPELNIDSDGTDSQWMNMETNVSSQSPTLEFNNPLNTQWPSETPEAPSVSSGSRSSKKSDEAASNVNLEINSPSQPPADSIQLNESFVPEPSSGSSDVATNVSFDSLIPLFSGSNANTSTWTGHVSDAFASTSSSSSTDEASENASVSPTNIPTTDSTSAQVQWSPPPVPSDPKKTDSASSASTSSESDNSSLAAKLSTTSPSPFSGSTDSSNSSKDAPFSPPPVANRPHTQATKKDHGSTSSTSNDSSDVSLLSKSDATSKSSESSRSTDKSRTSPSVEWSPPPVSSRPKQSLALFSKTSASSGSSSSSKSGVKASSDSSSDSKAATSLDSSVSSKHARATPSDKNAVSPAPVTRPPTMAKVSTKAIDDDNKTKQLESTSESDGSDKKGNKTYQSKITFESIKPASPGRAPRTPNVVSSRKYFSDASPEQVGTVMPAQTPDFDDVTSDEVAKRSYLGSKNQTTKDINMILLGDTGSAIVYTDGSLTKTFEKYTRESGNLQSLKDGSGSNSHLIVGGGNRANVPPGASISLSAMSQGIQNALLYTSHALGIVSIILLMIFHVLALRRPPWLSKTIYSNRRASVGYFTPNVWELAVAVGYMQHVGSIAMLELTKAPQIVLDYTDSFSFVNLHLSSVTTTTVSAATRRLQLIILTGIVAFADRIGIHEDKALMNAFWFFLAVVAALLMLFAAIAGIVYYNHTMSKASSVLYRTRLRNSSAMCVVGLGVALWILSIFPLVSMSSYEVVMELRYRVGFGLAVALFSLWAVAGGGLSIAFLSVRAIPSNVALQFKYFAVWGTLYGGCKMTFRYFFVVLVAIQAFLGIVTGTIHGEPTQLVALMVTHFLFVVVALIIRPFAASWVLVFIVGLRVVAIINVVSCFAFLTSSELSSFWRGIVAQGFVIFNSLIFFLFFVRYVTMFVLVLKQWSSFAQRESIYQKDSERLQESAVNQRQNLHFMTVDTGHDSDNNIFDASEGFMTPTQGTGKKDFCEFTSDRFASTPLFATENSYDAPTPSDFSSYPSNVHSHQHFLQ